jgi:hypothetical protein
MLIGPEHPSADPAVALGASSGSSVWSAMVRGRNIKAGDVLVCESEGTAAKGQVSVCVCVCVFVCVYTHPHTQSLSLAHTHTHTHMFVHTHTHTHTHISYPRISTMPPTYFVNLRISH